MLFLQSQLKPTNASCAWPDRCRFWRRFASSQQRCPARLLILTSGVGFPAATLAIAGGFLGATPIRGGCAGSNPYVGSYISVGIDIDIWGALAAGVWSSSAAFTIYGYRDAPAGNITLTGYAGYPVDGPLDPANVEFTTSFPTGSGCPSVAVATLTVYDDGTYTLT